MKRAIILVIDGLGVGSMMDVNKNRSQDIGAHTLHSIVGQDLSVYPNITTLGFFSLLNEHKPIRKNLQLSTGIAMLGYPGADSYLGHKELIGLPVNIEQVYLSEKKQIIERMLLKNKLKFKWIHSDLLCVEKNIFVGNNVEADLGNNINIYGNLDTYSFDEILKIGKLFRQFLHCSRVIVHGVDPALDNRSIRKGFVKRIHPSTGKVVYGISSGLLKVHNGKQSVIHMGFQDESKDNLIDYCKDANIPISLIGKTADLFSNKLTEYKKSKSINVVHTVKLLPLFKSLLVSQKTGLLFVNIQEIDLSGHNKDVKTARKVLQMFDRFIPSLLSLLKPTDLLVITADHGNDPLIGHDMHTREYVPVIMIGKEIPKRSIGVRNSLTDISATVLKYLNISRLSRGKAFI